MGGVTDNGDSLLTQYISMDNKKPIFKGLEWEICWEDIPRLLPILILSSLIALVSLYTAILTHKLAS